MNFDINEIAKSFAANIALNEARLREAGVQLARLEAEITAKQDEVAHVQASCKKAIQEALKERGEYEQAAAAVKNELLGAKAALDATLSKHATEIQEHAS